ncbi:MAG: tetratricopeptide repeat protein [Myxococcales bacterium]|nr:tetratricopeptide repeat protein [Myxococcales bacterium]
MALRARRRVGLAWVVCLIVLLSAAWSAPALASSSSALQLVDIARAHEQAGEQDVALRRYSEALAIDPTCGAAYLGMGALRAKRGDLREAERVYSVALEHLPALREAQIARAHVRRALGAHAEAVSDLLSGAPDDVTSLRTLAGWHGEDGHTPAQLAVWRRVLAAAEAAGDLARAHEARTMVRALQLLVGTADPVAAPPLDAHVAGRDPSDGLRRLVAYTAKRGAPVK